MEPFKLTHFSPGAGCGCKMAPQVLEEILRSETSFPHDPKLLVGHETKDDAAVYDLGNGQALISTTDFFTPIVDDPYNFGRIAAVNAISDVYAMGGRPILAIGILGWPLGKLPPETAHNVLEGARAVCFEAGIALAGGHSIDIGDPIFGLAVNGLVSLSSLKKNATATSGCHLILTKPLGVGLITTAEKRDLAYPEDKELALKWMTTLNKVGAIVSSFSGVKAMTDVTGFGLLGHLLEICEGSHLKATLNWKAIPKLPHFEYYIEKGCSPGGSRRNWQSYGPKIAPLSPLQQALLTDPQTSGGLLLAVTDDSLKQVKEVLEAHHLPNDIIGKLGDKDNDFNSPLISISE